MEPKTKPESQVIIMVLATRLQESLEREVWFPILNFKLNNIQIDSDYEMVTVQIKATI